MIKDELKKRYGNGNGWGAILRILEIAIPLYVAWAFTTTSVANDLKGQLKQLCTQTAAIAQSLDKHLQDYDIHVPHRPR